ncbi:MAG: hypothetical protein IJ634_03075 [Bacteroidales bacterium]|nr:hypothetical protein [Bacteroidales bacterium]
MKHIASILKDAIAFVGVAAIVIIVIFASTSASAQDLYQIEQSFGHDHPVNRLYISRGWDAHLHQSPKGTQTRVVVTTSCSEFFEEGHEPDLFSVKKLGKKDGWYFLRGNQSMPHTTRVVIYTSQTFETIELYEDARLTIHRYDFDSTELYLTADTGATLVVDTLLNRQRTKISLHNATLELQHLECPELTIWSYGESTVNESTAEGAIRCESQKLFLSNNTRSTVGATDSARHVYVMHKKRLDTEPLIKRVDLDLSLGLAMPIGFNDSRYGSPYNTNYTMEYHIALHTNDMPLNRNWTPRLCWDFGLDFGITFAGLDNIVREQNRRLVLDDSYGATPPRQQLYWYSLGLPITLKYKSKWLKPVFHTWYIRLTPTLNLNQFYGKRSLDEDSHWSDWDKSRVDILNRFKVRAAIGVNCAISGINKIEFFIDLLPTFKSSADAPQTRMMGLTYTF